MAIMAAFPTRVGVYEDIEMAKHCLHLNHKYLADPELAMRNRWDYLNTFHLGMKNPHLYDPQDNQYIVENIMRWVNTYTDECGFEPIQNPRVEYFFSVLNKGESHGDHQHPDCKLSGVFYLDTPKGCAPIKFFESNSYREMSKFTIKGEPTELNAEWFQIDPHVGQMLIWESWVHHSVPVNEVDGRRTLVFNVIGG